MNDYLELEALLDDFYKLTRIRISFWNESGVKTIMAPSDGDSGFCSELRKIGELDERCHECDMLALNKSKGLKNEMSSFQCDAGLVEHIYPVHLNDTYLGCFMFGQVRNQINDDEGGAMRKALYDAYGLDTEHMNRLYGELPQVADDALLSASRMLAALVSYAYLKNLLKIRNMSLAEKVRRYIEAHFAEQVTIETVCNELFVSRSTLCHALQNTANTTFIMQLNKYRVENVKKCLSLGMSISNASLKSGFQSSNYMTRIFKRFEGITPSQYQERIQS